MLIQTHEELEKEIDDKNKENTRIKKQLELNSETVEENMKLKKELEISDKEIEELKAKEIDSSRKIKELQDDHRYSDLIQKVDKDNLERDLLEKSEECSGLSKQLMTLLWKVMIRKRKLMD